MALTLDAEWLQAVQRRTVRARYLAIIEDGTNTWKALSGSCDSFTYPAGVVSVGSVGAELNPETRETEIGDTVVEFRDGWMRPIYSQNRLKGQALTVKVGAAEIAEDKFTHLSSGVIDSIVSDGKGQVVTVSALDLFSVLDDAEIVGYWVGVHPLETIYDGSGNGILEKANIPTALIDTSSFDPTDAAYSDISHWNIVRGGTTDYNGRLEVGEPTSALRLIREIGIILQGSLVINEQGQLSFARYDASAPVVDTWTDADIYEIRPVEHEAYLLNRVDVKFFIGADDKPKYNWMDEDTDSQSAYAYKGGDDRIITKVIETFWLNAWGRVLDTSFGSGSTELTVASELVAGFTGMRQAHAGGGQPSDAEIGASNPAYLMVRDGGSIGAGYEIIKATAADVASYVNECDFYVVDPDTGQQAVAGTFKNVIEFTTLARSQFGTTAAASVAQFSPVLDVTIPIAITQSYLARHGNGLTIADVIVGLRHFDKQLMDPVGITDNDWLAYGQDGLDGSEKFEIIRKEPRPDTSPPSISYRVASATSLTPSRNYGIRQLRQPSVADIAESQRDTASIRPTISSGFGLTTDSGFDGIVAAGKALAYPSAPVLEAARTHTYTASKDTYVYLNPGTNNIEFFPVANAAVAPDVPDHFLYLGKVVTDGAGITSNTNTDNPGMIQTGALDDDCVTNAKIGPLAVGTAELAAQAVETAKVAPNAIGGSQFVTEFADPFNFNFDDWTDG